MSNIEKYSKNVNFPVFLLANFYYIIFYLKFNNLFDQDDCSYSFSDQFTANYIKIGQTADKIIMEI